MSSIKEQGDLLYTLTHQTAQNGMFETWSSQKWKSDELLEVRTRRPVVFAQHTDRFIVEDDETKFLHRSRIRNVARIQIIFCKKINDQVRKRKNQTSKGATKDSDQHSVIWTTFMSSTLRASVFMRKNYSDNLHSSQNTEDLTI